MSLIQLLKFKTWEMRLFKMWFIVASGLKIQWWPFEILRQNVSFCPSPTNDIPKTNKVPFKSPIKMLPEMQKKIWIFQNLLVFRAFFEKAVFLENGHGRHQTGAMPIHYTFIFSESQWGSPPESFIQKYWLVSNLPIFQNYCFFKKRP